MNNIARRYEDTLDLPDINYAFDNGNEKDWIIDPANATKFGMSPVSYYEAINVRPILLKPKSRGYILLNETHPIWGQPLIYPRFFTKGSDLDILVEGNVNIIHIVLPIRRYNINSNSNKTTIGHFRKSITTDVYIYTLKTIIVIVINYSKIFPIKSL